jgi:hypothetical protein
MSGDRTTPDGRRSIRRDNPKLQGLIGLGDAIAWFTRNGYDVLLPLNDSQKFDLAVQAGDSDLIQRVQVKTSTYRTPYGNFSVDLRTNGGNQSRHTTEFFDASHYDLLYAYTDADERYLIPASVIRSRCSVTLGAKWARYRV